MKPLKEDQQLGSVSRLYSVTLQALKPKSSPRRRRGLDASTDRALTERSGEVFFLDILSHRMSANAFYEKVIKVKADVAAFLINCLPSAYPSGGDVGTKRNAVQLGFVP